MDTTPYTPSQGLLLVFGYAAAAFALTWWLARRDRRTKDGFLLADRRIGRWPAAFSIAATWIWAPALFVAAEKAYTQGVAGVFWFTAPNVACLLLFAPFAARIRRLAPDGVTLSEWLARRHSRRVQVLYLVQLGGLAACSFAVQLLAGGKVIAWLTGLPFGLVTVLLALVALSYSLFSGLRASVVTDWAQMALILVVLAVVVPWAVGAAGDGAFAVGWEAMGWGGASGRFGALFSDAGLGVAWAFGVPVTIGLLSGPFGDQSFWQRAFAIREGHVAPAFVRAAFVFGVVPLALSLLGFLASGLGWSVDDPALVNIETVRRLLPAWTLLPVVVMLLSGLVSTLDSNLCAIASLAGHDLPSVRTARTSDQRIVHVSRLAMLALAAAALAIANVPGVKILYLFLFYGTLRASTLLPTVLTLLGVRLRESAVFVGILAAIGVGLPVFAYGNFTGRTAWTVAGSLLTVALSGGAAWLGSLGESR